MYASMHNCWWAMHVCSVVDDDSGDADDDAVLSIFNIWHVYFTYQQSAVQQCCNSCQLNINMEIIFNLLHPLAALTIDPIL